MGVSVMGAEAATVIEYCVKTFGSHVAGISVYELSGLVGSSSSSRQT